MLRGLTGVTALCLWFYAIGKLPPATAMTLNYTSSLWIALLRAGETENRIVFYFSIGGVLGGAALSTLTGWHAHSLGGIGLLLAVGVFATVAGLLREKWGVRGAPHRENHFDPRAGLIEPTVDSRLLAMR